MTVIPFTFTSTLAKQIANIWLGSLATEPFTWTENWSTSLGRCVHFVCPLSG